MADVKKEIGLITALGLVGELLKLYREYEAIEQKKAADTLAFIAAVLALLKAKDVTLEDLADILAAVGPFLGVLK